MLVQFHVHGLRVSTWPLSLKRSLFILIGIAKYVSESDILVFLCFHAYFIIILCKK